MHEQQASLAGITQAACFLPFPILSSWQKLSLRIQGRRSPDPLVISKLAMGPGACIPAVCQRNANSKSRRNHAGNVGIRTHMAAEPAKSCIMIELGEDAL